MAEPVRSRLIDELEPDISDLQIEDDEPVDSIFSEKQQQLLVESLDASLREELRPFVALANVGLFASPDQPPMVPDVMVAFETAAPGPLDKKKNKTYLIWNYGSPPDIVFEIVSNLEGHEDTSKMEKYAHWRIGHYVIYDPFEYLGTRRLRAFQLHGNKYVELLDPYSLPDFELGFQIREGLFRGYEGPWLRWTDKDGEVLLTGVERALLERERADIESARADEQSARADEQSARADAEKARAELLAEKLKALGHEF